MGRLIVILLGLMMGGLLHAQSVEVPQEVSLANVGSEPNPFAQTVVEAIRLEANAEIGWLGAAFFSDASFPKGTYKAEDLLKGLLYPDDQVVVLSLKGNQIQQALERAIELHPQKNNAFLQLAGMTVTFNPNAPARSRILTVKIGKETVNPDRTYTVATTAPLARGALGYFRVWDKNQMTKNTNRTVAEALQAYLRGKAAWIAEPAWIEQK